MANHAQRRPLLSTGLPAAELEFVTELRRLVDLAGLTCRALEKSTSSARSASGDACFYSKSQWGRWLNAQGPPPRKAIRRLAETLAREDVDARHLTDMWERAFAPEPCHATAAVRELPSQLPPDDAIRFTCFTPEPPLGMLVGRDSELSMLTGLVKGVAAGQGDAVLIEGEPGIGKSALVRAALAQAAGLGCGVFWGTGDELGQALPLQPLLDGLRVREPSTNPRRNTIVRFLRGEVAPDRGIDGSAVLAEQLLALIAEQCAMQPTILVIDDLQWVDPVSIRL